MSVEAMAWAFEQEVSGTDKVVLLALANYADDTARCWPGIRRLAHMARRDERTVKRSLRVLEDGRLVRRHTRLRDNGSQTSNFYTLVMGVTPTTPPHDADVTPPDDTGVTPRTVSKDPSVRKATVERLKAPLSDLLADLIERNGSKRPTVSKRWADEERRMLELDMRSPEEALSLIEWCQNDLFWKGNILSMPKFREKYDTLRLQREREQPVIPDDGFED